MTDTGNNQEFTIVVLLQDTFCLLSFTNSTKMVNRKRFLFRLLFAIYVMSTTVLGYNPGTSWRNPHAFAALKEDGTVAAWGDSSYGGSGVPSGLSGVKTIYSTKYAFAALKEDGTVAAWGNSGNGGSGVPSGLSGVKSIFSTYYAFAALKEDGTVVAWGSADEGGDASVVGQTENSVVVVQRCGRTKAHFEAVLVPVYG